MHFTDKDFRKTDFYEKHRSIVSEPTGAGFFIWKPYYILETLRKMADGDLLLYADSGHAFESDPSPLFDLCKEQDIILFENYQGYIFFSRTGLAFTEYNCYTEVNKCKYWCKNDSFRLLGLEGTAAEEAFLTDASIMLFRKSAKAMEFVEEWLGACTDRRMISFDPNEDGKEEVPGFQFHIYDQSLISLIAWKYRLSLYRCPSQYGNHYKLPQYRQQNEYLMLPYATNPKHNSPYATITLHHRYKPHGFGYRFRQFLYREAMMLPVWMSKPFSKKLEARKGFY
ncbi:MAG TPA: hypothetical protein VLC98_12215 [Phnomibacter sp.]|nr:hypothetical protein [Phnomibacter sp.]